MDTDSHNYPKVDTRFFDWLAYFGLIPFVVGIFMQWLGLSILGVTPRLLFTTYSAVILSFLCGVWWGAALNRVGHPHRLMLALLSNLVTLLGWGALLMFRTSWALPVLLLAFGFVAWAEAKLNPNLPGRDQYFRTRSIVTYLVMFCHLFMILLIL
ncbi:DUF3429 domain-containing protein [Microbulbifer sp. VAAF005]|uniref:DUF3429 domain-containing protein n=1 Tax=Microbulbifer sp. VAAF005 TaxID=3034230 RepID=UPI0024AD7662|nr:DUF3429 domain-containing protein [Microbulbifer sp. VAAF005]WHI46522.1 DUF3429 domain-containing protein [Microbulbifer sp. VAAF005]